MNKIILSLLLLPILCSVVEAASYEELRKQEDERILKEEEREAALRRVLRQRQGNTNPFPKDSKVIWFEAEGNMRLLDIPDSSSGVQGSSSLPVTSQPKAGERPPRFPARSFWVTGDDMPDGLIDGLLLKFVRTVLRQIRCERGRDYRPTYDDLMKAFMNAWGHYTPYKSAFTGVGSKLDALKDRVTGAVSDNDWRLIFRRGYGICGDYSQLLKKMLELALFHEQCRYILDVEPLIAPKAELGGYGHDSVGFARVDEVYFIGKPNKTHCALGIISKDAYTNCVRTISEHQQDGSVKTKHIEDLTNLSRYDIKVYDLFLRPLIIGNMTLGEWGGKCNSEAFIVKRMISSSYRLVYGPDSMAPRAQWAGK